MPFLITGIVCVMLWGTAQEAAAPQPQADTGKPTTQEGPMRVEIAGMVETRFRFIEPPPGPAPQARLQIQFKLRGARLKEIVRLGHLIFTEVVDETGKAMVDPNTYDKEKLTGSRVIENVEQIIAQQGGIAIVEAFDLSARAARKISTMKGYWRIYYASAPEEIVIEDPLRYAGQIIEHPRLAALGVKIRIYGPGQEGLPADGKQIGVQILEGEEKVQGTDFYDDWYRLIASRPRPMTDSSGASFQAYRAGAMTFSSEYQMVVRVFADVRSEDLPVEFRDVELP